MAGSSIEVHHADRLGSIRAITDDTGTVVASFRTDEFGVPTSSTGAAGSPFRYTGEPRDASGLTYLRARYYEPSNGRFMSRDPFAGFRRSPLSLNRYGYVHNNPGTWTDLSGLASSQVLSAVGGICGTAGGGVPGHYEQYAFCLVVDSFGQFGFAWSGASGIGSGVDLTLGGALLASNAPSIYDLSGSATDYGGLAGVGRSGGLDIIFGTGANDQPTVTVQAGVQGSFQFSLVPSAGPYEIHVIEGITQVQSIDLIGFIEHALAGF